MQSFDEWAQNYQESISSMPELSFDEPFDATDFAPGNMSSPKVSSLSSNGGGLSPKGSIGKPIRRRSRASKKAPTTLLTADTNNFRALVQQFTGCHSAPPAFGTYKGPINLNFEQYNYYSEKREDQKQQQVDWNLREESDQSFFSFGTNNIAAITTTTTTTTATMTDDRELFGSRVNHNPRPDRLTLDDFDIENFSIQDLSGPEDYSTVLPGARNDDFRGY